MNRNALERQKERSRKAMLAHNGSGRPLRQSPPRLVEPSVPTKLCARCRQTKPVTEFSISRGATDGRQGYCQQCMKDYATEKKIERAQRKAERAQRMTALKDYVTKKNAERDKKRRAGQQDRSPAPSEPPPIPLRMPPPVEVAPQPRRGLQRSRRPLDDAIDTFREPWREAIRRALDPVREHVQNLELEVYDLRRALLDMIPKELGAVFREYNHCKTIDDFMAWERKILDAVVEHARMKVVAIAKSDGVPEDRIWWMRDYCPLCGAGTWARGRHIGWSIPAGLQEHLGRYRGGCSVMRTAIQNAEDHLHDRLVTADIAAKRALQERRHTDTVLMIDLNHELVFWTDQQVIAAAEQRLAEIGFTRYQEKNVVCYQLAYELAERRYGVIADPTSSECIRFYIYALSPKGGQRAWAGAFKLNHRVTRDLKAKFKTRFAECVSRTSARHR